VGAGLSAAGVIALARAEKCERNTQAGGRVQAASVERGVMYSLFTYRSCAM
jgi:hypothetical protein